MTKFITSTDIDNSTLIIEDNKLKVNADAVVPKAKADRFLKSVAANGDNTGIVFTTSAEDEEDSTLELPLSGFLEGVVRQSQLEEATFTKAKLIEMLSDSEVVTKLKEVLKGEEVRTVSDELKGYLLAQ